MDRRDFLMTAGAFAFAAAPPLAVAAEGGHEHHHHSASSGEKALADAAFACERAAEACLEHCLEMLSSGDQTMVACARSTREMLILCEAVAKGASMKSKRLKQLARLAMDACKECEDECRKHAAKHAVCKDCADACAECYKQCQAYSA